MLLHRLQSIVLCLVLAVFRNIPTPRSHLSDFVSFSCILNFPYSPSFFFFLIGDAIEERCHWKVIPRSRPARSRNLSSRCECCTSKYTFFPQHSLRVRHEDLVAKKKVGSYTLAIKALPTPSAVRRWAVQLLWTWHMATGRSKAVEPEMW